MLPLGVAPCFVIGCLLTHHFFLKWQPRSVEFYNFDLFYVRMEDQLEKFAFRMPSFLSLSHCR